MAYLPVRSALAVIQLSTIDDRWARYARALLDNTCCWKHAGLMLTRYMSDSEQTKICFKWSAHWPISLQYGFVNHALELLVLRNYGPEVWEDIKWVFSPVPRLCQLMETHTGKEIGQAANKSLILTSKSTLLKAYKYGQQNALYGLQNSPCEFSLVFYSNDSCIYKNP